MKDIPEIIKKRHSTREFTDKRVDFELLETLVEGARLAPSACNLQLTEFIILDDEKIIKELADNVDRKFTWAPNFIVVIYDPRFTKHHLAGVQSAGMAVENLLLTAESLGLGACPMAGFENDAKLKKILEIPDDYEVALAIAVGYPREGFEKSQERLELKEICHRNKYNGTPLKDSLKLGDWSVKDIINYRKRIAPVYLYKNHHHLGSFDPKITERIAADFRILISQKQEKNKTVLDLFTYDGDFLSKIICDFSHNPYKDFNFYASDYLPYTLKIAKEENSIIETKLINENNKIVDVLGESIDIITCVNKINFIPNREEIFKEVFRVLKPGGLVYIATFENEMIKKWIKELLTRSKKAKNVYEENPFYKIGPCQIIGKDELKEMMHGAGFVVELDYTDIITETKGINNFYYLGFKKQ